MELTFSGVESEFVGSCENIKTTKLPFHLITLANNAPGILITSLNGHTASFKCGATPIVLAGNGILGTITSPACGGSSNKATLSFKPSIAGHQQHTTITGVAYGLTSSIFGSVSPVSIDTTMTITFPANRTLTCT